MDELIRIDAETRIQVLVRRLAQAVDEAAAWEAAYRTLAAQQDKPAEAEGPES